MATTAINAETEHHRRFIDEYQHLSRPFGSGSFGAKAEAFARFFGTPTFLIGQTLIVGTWIVLNAAKIVQSNDKRRSINIYSRRGAPVIAVNDGVIKKIGHNGKLGNFVVLQDVFGNRYTYANLASVSER